ncbi:putative exported protein (RatA) [Salmonella enterica subsp. enterica]|nr:putative exported protein (RatA) [Salmonella enterica subsp. enterica]
MDDAIQAVKAKNSESIPLLITTTDAMGNPVPYATFSLKTRRREGAQHRL